MKFTVGEKVTCPYWHNVGEVIEISFTPRPRYLVQFSNKHGRGIYPARLLAKYEPQRVDDGPRSL